MKHIVGLIIMAFIVLSLYLAPGAGTWVVGTLGGLGVIAAGFSLLNTETDIVKLLIGQSVKDKLGPWQSATFQFVRSALVVAFLYGLSYTAIALSAKYLLIAGYLSLQLSAGRLLSVKNTLIRRAYSLKV